MNKLANWWTARSVPEQLALTVIGSVLTIATGGAVVYAIANGGLIVVSGPTLVAVGAAAKELAKRV